MAVNLIALRRRSRKGLALALALALGVGIASSHARGGGLDGDSKAHVDTLIHRLAQETGEARVQLAKELANVAHDNPDVWTDSSIRKVAGLLADPNRSVRYWASIALRYFGARATFAVPALKQALADAEAQDSAKSFTTGRNLWLEILVTLESLENDPSEESGPE